jgi:hypothetical protein
MRIQYSYNIATAQTDPTLMFDRGEVSNGKYGLITHGVTSGSIEK